VEDEMEKYIVKKAEIGDLDLVAPLFNEYRMFYEQNSDLEGGRQFILERMKNKQSVIFLAIENQHEFVVPLGFVQLYPSFSSVSMKKIWILNDLYVDISVRQRGIAKKLMETAKNYAIETGTKSLILETTVNNHQAKKLYEALGYRKDIHHDHYELMLNEGKVV
jgi:ribosomal protein S18 acetylase RimI-like enzyme